MGKEKNRDQSEGPKPRKEVVDKEKSDGETIASVSPIIPRRGTDRGRTRNRGVCFTEGVK